VSAPWRSTRDAIGLPRSALGPAKRNAGPPNRQWPTGGGEPANVSTSGGGRQMNRSLWSVLRLWIRLHRGRWPRAALADPIWYFAYGSNMNERLFRERRHMTWHEARVGRLQGHRLVFTVAGGMRPGVSAPVNIVEAPGESVYGVLYLLPLRKFARLDNSEGKQYAYF
jgi:hypothetical protein